MLASQESTPNDIPADSEPKPAKPWQFDSQTAKERVAKAWELRRQRKAAGLQKTFKKDKPADPTFEDIQLTVTRARIVAEYEALASESDPDLRFKIGTLLKRLWEIYQLLAQKPSPGTMKPRAERPTRSSGAQLDGQED